MQNQMNKQQKKKTVKVNRTVGRQVLTTASDSVPNRAIRRQNRPRAGVYLSRCAQDYARCLVNPFTGPLACIPAFPIVMTRKCRVWSKGTFSTGSNAEGWIVCDPQLGAANDLTCVMGTTPANAGTTVNIVVSPATASFGSNSDYVSGQFGINDIQFKVVACGLRIRYTGTNLNMGGTIVALSDPSHNSLQGRNYGQFQAEVTSKQFSFGRSWINILYKPVLTQELDNHFSAGLVTPAPTDPTFFMGAFVNSAVPGQPFEFEYYAVYEFEGANVRGQTPSHADPSGFAAIQVASLQSPTTMPREGNDTRSHEKSFLTEVGQALLATGSTLFGELEDSIGPAVEFLKSDLGKLAGSLAVGALTM